MIVALLARSCLQSGRYGLALLIAGLCFGATAALAQNGTWTGPGAEWTTGTNWSSNPNVPTGTATFTNNAAPTAVTTSGLVIIGDIGFTGTAPAYTVTIGDFFIVNGGGITNSSASLQTFDVAGSSISMVFQNGSSASAGTGPVSITNAGGNFISFLDSSTAGSAGITNNGVVQFSNNSSAGTGATVTTSIINNGQLDFFDASTAGAKTITNSGAVTFNNNSTAASATIDNSGAVIFGNASTAGNALITNNNGATLTFDNSSSAGGATITNNVGATMSFNNTSTAGTANITNDAALSFNNTSTAAGSQVTNNAAATLSFNDTSTAGTATIGNAGTVSFNTSANAGNASITNNSGAFLDFNNASTASAATITNNANGTTQFLNTSTAGNATIINMVNGITQFFTNSTAGSATIDNNGGLTQFNNSSTAGTATITTRSGGGVFFVGTSSGGQATFITNAGGVFDMSGLTSAGTTAGSIAGAGTYFLGSKTLTVGGNDLSTTVSGVISDGGLSGGVGGSLVKVGTGTLTLSGIDTYTGANTVDAGALIVNGSVAASSGVTVNSGGTLGGVGTVSTTTVNAGGTLAPGNGNIGTLNVSGNLSFMSGSTYLVEVGPASAGRTNVTGTATLAGTVEAAFAPGNGVFTSNSYTILSAAGGRTGTFDALATVNMPGFLTASLSYTPTDVLLMTLRSQINQPGLTANESAVARTLDSAFNSGNGLFAGLFAVPPSQIPAALDALSGEGTSGTQETAFGAGDLFVTAMMEQGAFWRNGDTVDTNGVTLAMPYAPDKAQAPAFKAMPTKAPVFEERWRAWTTGFGGTWRLAGEADPGSATLTHNTGGAAAGLDYQLNPNLLLGVAAGGSLSNFSVPDRATSGTLDGAHLGSYAVARSGPWYAAGALAFHAFENQTDRTIAGIGATETAMGRFNSDMLSGRLEVGFKQAFNGVAVTPFAAVQFAELWQAGYTEASTAASGAPGILGLSYASQAVSSLPTFLGTQFDWRTVLANGSVLSPYARVSWVHEFDPVRDITASFISLPGTGSTVDGPRTARDAARIDAGAKITISRSAALFASFDGEFSDRGQMYAGTGGLKVSW